MSLDGRAKQATTLTGTSARDTFLLGLGSGGNDTISGGGSSNTSLYDVISVEFGTTNFFSAEWSSNNLLFYSYANAITPFEIITVKDALLSNRNFTISIPSYENGGLQTSYTLAKSQSGTAGNDFIAGTSANNTLNGANGDDYLFGGAGNDSVIGGLGDDILVGGHGNDTLQGNEGDDNYVISTTLNGPNPFQDTIRDTAGLVDSVTLINDLDNVFIDATRVGNNLSFNTLMLTQSSVQSVGRFTINNQFSDSRVEYIQIIDNRSFNYSDAFKTFNNSPYYFDEEENDWTYIVAPSLTGKGANELIVGDSNANLLRGNGGSDMLSGGAGADTIYGGTGSDTLFAGTDPSTAINLLYGEAGDDWLSGIGSAKTSMYGGIGSDTYVIDNIGDSIIETITTSNQYDYYNRDFVISYINNYVLPANVEDLYVAVSNGSGTGNSAANTLIGNSSGNLLSGLAGADVLNGGAGADTMEGGTGSDTYYVNDKGDIIRGELPSSNQYDYNEQDYVYSVVDFTLPVNVESLTLSGTSDINATGNSGQNYITGNAGNNIINGKGGADYLTGGAGNDSFVFDTTPVYNPTQWGPSISDFDGAKDKIQLDDAKFAGVSKTSNGVISSSSIKFLDDYNYNLPNLFNSKQVFFVVTSSPTGKALYFNPNGGDASDSVMVTSITLTSGTFDISDILII